MTTVDRLIASRGFRLTLGVLAVVYAASVLYEWYVEGYLPFGP